MTKFDIKEYLEKIYCIPVMGINTQIFEGKRRRTYTDPKKSFSQEPEYKIAWISLVIIFLKCKFSKLGFFTSLEYFFKESNQLRNKHKAWCYLIRPLGFQNHASKFTFIRKTGPRS